jgi:hypothetical protein
VTSPAAGFLRLLDALRRLGISYMVGGSLASSIHGIPRSTNDIDLVADVSLDRVPALVAEMRPEFYIDPPEAIHRALQTGRMFNLIHLASSYKYDLYPLSPEPYQQAAFARRQEVESSLVGAEPVRFYVSSPEDTILAKLSWYRSGGGVSERQWSDVLDVIRVKRDLLDLTYLRQWARQLQVVDLLEEALS